MVKGIIIPVDAEEGSIQTEVHALEDYQAVVGGWIEPVDVPALGITIYLNEEGLIRQLPFNSRATLLWWSCTPAARQQAVLVGPALVVGLPDEDGNSTDVPTDVLELLALEGRWRVQARIADDPHWYQDQEIYDDFFEAVNWAMVTLVQWNLAEDVRVVRVTDDKLRVESESSGPTPPAA